MLSAGTVMTGAASDPATWQQHVRNKAGLKLADRFKDRSIPSALQV